MASAGAQMNGVRGATLAGLFSSGVVQEMARRGRSPSFSRLARESGIGAAVEPTDRVRAAFDLAFRELKGSYRGEYVFKATIAKNVLLGKHSINTAVMLTEFRVGSCKADVVILNGTSTAYEIKSDLDRLDRLTAQVSTYLKAFARVCVVASERHIASIRAQVPAEVGVLRLSKNGRISTVQESVEDPGRVDPATVFETLRLHEARKILGDVGVRAPDVPNTRLHAELRRIFETLDARSVHDSMVATLRKTRSHKAMADLLTAVPACLQAAALTTRVRRADQERLCAALDTRMTDALRWD